MRRVSVLIIVLLGIGAALPASAPAQDNSAIDQYTENVPSPGGNDPSDETGGGGGGSPSGTGGGDSGAPLPGTSAEQLQSQGPAGAATAELAQATAPERAARSNDSPGDEGPGRPGGSAAGADSGGPSVDDVVRGVTDGSDSDGLGLWLPIILGATLVAAIAVGVARWRRGPGEPTQA